MAEVSEDSLEQVRRELLDDVAECWFSLKRKDSQAHRRNYVRAVFAMVEGWVSVLKAYVIAEVEGGRFEASRAEIAVLREEDYRLTDRGKPKTSQALLRSLQNLKFTFDIFARAHGVERPDFGVEGFEVLREAVQVRHRVTHPKATADLDVSDEELSLVDEAWSWFMGASFDVYVTGRAQLLAKIEAMKGD